MNARQPSKVVLAQMNVREKLSWQAQQKPINKRLLRNTAFFAVVSFCLGGCVWGTVKQPQAAQAVMSSLTAGFEYDESLGKLQLVSNMLPESAMVFLHTDSSDIELCTPVQAQASHVWSQREPWLEYTCSGDIAACRAGEVVTVVKNHAADYTIRILHEGGYESVYSGIHDIYAAENDIVRAGQIIGSSPDTTAFELRRDGVSVLPVFSER